MQTMKEKTMTDTARATVPEIDAQRLPAGFQVPAGCADTLEGGTEAETEAPAAPEGFLPDTEAKVDWVLAKVAAARAEAKLIRENAELMAREKERDADALEWRFGPAIQTWLNGALAGSKKKSKRLFHGVVGYRTKPAGLTITDPTDAGKWAREFCPSAIVSSLDRKALAAFLLETGESVDFAAFQPEEEQFYMK